MSMHRSHWYICFSANVDRFYLLAGEMLPSVWGDAKWVINAVRLLQATKGLANARQYVPHN